jgi:TPR repeat protein
VKKAVFDSILQDFYFSRELSDAAERALYATGSTGIAIALKQEDRFVCCAKAGETAPGIGVTIEPNSGITGKCISSGVTIVCGDTASDPLVDAAVCQQLGVASLIAVPITKSGVTVGVIEAFCNVRFAYGSVQQAKLEKFAGEIDPSRFSPSFVIEESDNSEVKKADVPLPAFATTSLRSSTGHGEGKHIGRAALAPILGCAVLALVFGGYSHVVSRSATAGPQRSQPSKANVPRPRPVSRVTKVKPQATQPVPATVITSHNGLATLEQQARQGNSASQLKLAETLASGRGVPQDLIAAYAWYTLANIAGQNNASALLTSLSHTLSDSQIAQVRVQLAHMFWNGVGVRRDLAAAYTWFLLARAAGSTEALSEQKQLAADMTDAQISAARRRAYEWLARHHMQTAVLRD